MQIIEWSEFERISASASLKSENRCPTPIDSHFKEKYLNKKVYFVQVLGMFTYEEYSEREALASEYDIEGLVIAGVYSGEYKGERTDVQVQDTHRIKNPELISFHDFKKYSNFMLQHHHVIGGYRYYDPRVKKYVEQKVVNNTMTVNGLFLFDNMSDAIQSAVVYNNKQVKKIYKKIATMQDFILEMHPSNINSIPPHSPQDTIVEEIVDCDDPKNIPGTPEWNKRQEEELAKYYCSSENAAMF